MERGGRVGEMEEEGDCRKGFGRPWERGQRQLSKIRTGLKRAASRTVVSYLHLRGQGLARL